MSYAKMVREALKDNDMGRFTSLLLRYFPKINHEKCIKCCVCLKGCPQKAISLKNKKIVIDYDECIACFCCQEFCPQAAIKIDSNIIVKIKRLCDRLRKR